MKYHMKINKSFFRYGITIPKDGIDAFLMGKKVPLGKSRVVTLVWGRRRFEVKLQHINRKGATPVYQLRWDNHLELLAALKKEFIQSYIAIESENLVADPANKHAIIKLAGGNQEVMVFEPVGSDEISIKTFIQVTTPYDELFRRLVDANVFGWLVKEDVSHMITQSTKWFDIKDLSQHVQNPFVVYYLVDSKAKELYIGSARVLGDRVKPGRKEIPGWNKFRYESVHPQYHKDLREIEYHSIMAFARFMKNKGRLSGINLSDYTLVNKDYKYYR